MPNEAAPAAPAAPEAPAAPAATPLPSRNIQTVSPSKAFGLDASPREELSKMTSDLHTRSKANVTVDIDDHPKKETVKEEPKVEEKKVEEKKQPEQKVEEPKKPEAPKPPTPPAQPEKVKIGDKEYTQDELKALIEKQNQPQPPVEPPKPTEPKPEEVKAQQDALKRQERQFIEDQIRSATENNAPWLISNEQEMDTILDGGMGAVQLFNQKLAEARYEADISARKWASEAIESLREELTGQVKPVIEHHSRIEAYQREQNFYKKFPELAVEGEGREARVNLVRGIVNALRNHQNEAVRKQIASMTPEQFDEEVAKQTKDYCTRFGIPLTPVAIPPVQLENDPKPPTTPAATPPTPPAPKPPTPTVPTAGAGAGGKPLDWNSQTARELRNY